ncbi:hypothetical protein Phum_PHUM058020 [Pediculus humanus corporis]|uniref:Neuromodulin n=1 Tax=Pediculus humanus subsp. corporis TaxID=121224 RepID=E0VBC9_PEDHC|nr:uncharacterized protein Phum_PHUM058020 [Pediculus humanus corporis]EEB10685.1 hypothetical protein Phum_PHUM058020 [Pediculus humanus corporis]
MKEGGKENGRHPFLLALIVGDIDLNDPTANKAATKIQAAFRGHQTRKTMKQGDAEPQQQQQQQQQNLNEEFNAENKELCEAAIKIQASFRGHLVRKTANRKDEEELSKELEKLDAKAPEEEELDIDLNDPDLQVAATKIQASFRGHRVRKDKQSGSNE